MKCAINDKRTVIPASNSC